MITNEECTSFLQWSLPKLRMRYEGFRKVRKRVCKRIRARVNELGLQNIDTYKAYIEKNAEEYVFLDSICRINISRFYRDQQTFDVIATHILPLLRNELLSHNESQLNVWSIGCASGQEPYTIRMIWELCCGKSSNRISIKIIATDIDADLLERARQGKFTDKEMKELPPDLKSKNFYKTDDNKSYYLDETIKSDVEFIVQDIRRELPKGGVHLIVCRNLVFTYFDISLQIEIATRFKKQLMLGGYIVLGSHESIPDSVKGLTLIDSNARVYQKNL